MLYQEIPIHPELSPHIQLIWTMESEHKDEKISKMQILPDGIVEIVFHYRDPWITARAGDDPMMQEESFAISQMRKYIEIEQSRKTGLISVRFYPWGAYHFFSYPIRDFLDDSISTKLLWGNNSDLLMQKIKASRSFRQRAKVLQDFLSNQFLIHQKKVPEIDQTLKRIRETKGILTIAELCRQTGFSKKQLQRKFLESVGTTPKIFSRITRFLNICNHLHEYGDKTLTELSYECGFYDQAHFIKEFREFSGFSPREYFRRKNVYFAEI